ncbi:MAG: hypothetical protein ABGY75_04750 [Gemmataceae bacterium]
MWKRIALGAAVGGLLSSFTLSAQTIGPGPTTPGYAYARVAGATVDHVVIPPGESIPTERIVRGYLTALGVAVAAGGLLGGLAGWGFWGRRRRREPAVSG